MSFLELWLLLLIYHTVCLLKSWQKDSVCHLSLLLSQWWLWACTDEGPNCPACQLINRLYSSNYIGPNVNCNVKRIKGKDPSSRPYTPSLNFILLKHRTKKKIIYLGPMNAALFRTLHLLFRIHWIWFYLLIFQGIFLTVGKKHWVLMKRGNGINYIKCKTARNRLAPGFYLW